MLATTRDSLYERYRQVMESGEDELADEAYRCPTAEYRTPERLASERAGLFRGGPLVVALTADLPEPNSAFSTDIDGVPLLVTRDGTGEARVFVNACRHRGSRLFDGQGTVPPALVCPYHAWSYRLDGRLHTRPQGAHCFAGENPEGLGLIELPSDEVYGLILARLDGRGSVDGAEFLGDIAPELASYDIASYHHIETRHHEWAFNWKIGMDTFLEAYHIFALHKDSISDYIPSWPLLINPRGDHMFTFAPWRRLEQQDSAENLLSHGTVQNVICPNMLITHQIDHIETWNFYPKANDPSTCVIKTSLYAPRAPQSEKELTHWHKNLAVLMRVVTGEDFPQCMAIQHAIDSGQAPEHFLFGQNEKGLIWYHRQLDAMLQSAAATSVDR